MLSAVHAWDGGSSQRGMQDSGHRVTFSAHSREFHAEGCQLGVTRLPADPPVRLRVHTKRYSLLRVRAALTGTCIASRRRPGVLHACAAAWRESLALPGVAIHDVTYSQGGVKGGQGCLLQHMHPLIAIE